MAAATPDGDVVAVPEPDDFVRAHVLDNPWLAARRDLFARWFDTPHDREEVAEREGMTLGELLRAFNDTAPLDPPIGYRYAGTPFEVVAMPGVCDDVHGPRFPKFGDPVTLRVFCADETLLPREMYEAADWNFMDAGRDGFVGYVYGVRHDDTLYVAGMQSDLCVRYAYLFQRTEPTDVRTGDTVTHRSPAELVERYRACVPVLRRSFQRRWAEVLLAGIATWARADGALAAVALLRLTPTEDEQRPGHLVERVYDLLPRRVGAWTRTVRVGHHHHSYNAMSLAAVERFLGERWDALPTGAGH